MRLITNANASARDTYRGIRWVYQEMTSATSRRQIPIAYAQLFGATLCLMALPYSINQVIDSLAVGGENGTLERRFEDLAARVRGKSGYIRHTITLSGYLSSGPRTYVFSILLNDYRKPVFRGKRLIDRIVAEMDAELAAAEPTSLGSD